MSGIDRRTLLKGAAIVGIARKTLAREDVSSPARALGEDALLAAWRERLRLRNDSITDLYLSAVKSTSRLDTGTIAVPPDSELDDGEWAVYFTPREYLIRVVQEPGTLVVHTNDATQEIRYEAPSPELSQSRTSDAPLAGSPARFLENFLPVLGDEYASVESDTAQTQGELVIRQGFRRIWLNTELGAITRFDEHGSGSSLVSRRRFEDYREVAPGLAFPFLLTDDALALDGTILRTFTWAITEVLVNDAASPAAAKLSR